MDIDMTTPPHSSIHLQDKRILITGGARGLGASFVRSVHAAGARVCIADRLAEEGQALAQALGERAHFVHLDLADPNAITAGVEQAVDWLGGLDGLVNNGAITNSGGKAFDELDPLVWDQVMTVNVKGAWLMTRACSPHLQRSAHGRVVNLASDTALWGAPRLMAYVASKGAIVAMTRSLAREMGAHGITVNAIAPGLTEVEATRYVPAERHEHYLKGRSIQRPQVPQDIDGLMLFLLSDWSDFISGQLIAVNGGFVFN
jgi:NAD(P)-dependent dehydrogenase (short-subunit alcohol dehydrogenase family)